MRIGHGKDALYKVGSCETCNTALFSKTDQKRQYCGICGPWWVEGEAERKEILAEDDGRKEF